MQGSTATITVLFTDLVGSTDLLRFGAEAFDDIRRSHFDAARAAIEGHRGAFVKSTGDGVLATFGSTSDAVAAAVAVQQRVEVLTRADVRTPAVRVGLARRRPGGRGARDGGARRRGPT